MAETEVMHKEEVETEDSTEAQKDIKPVEKSQPTEEVKTEDSTEAQKDINTDEKAPTEEVKTEDATEAQKDINTDETSPTDEVKTEDSKEAQKDINTDEKPPTEEVKTEDSTEAQKEKPKDNTHDIKSEENENKTNGSTPSLLQMKIIRQVEYYFGNVNLWRDKFLKEKITEDDGWVTLECLITFNRLQALSMDFEEIATALQKSKTGLLEIHEDKRKIRRSLSNPLPDPDDPIIRKASKMKTLYVKGFPTSYTLDDVQDFILSQECQNIFVKMKYDEEKNFKGSIIVELATLQEADKFLKTEIKCADTLLKVLRRDDYFSEKNEKRHGRKDFGKRRGRDDDENGHGKRTRGEEKEQDNKEDPEPPKLGCVLHFKGCSTETTREDLKSLFGEHEPVEWVDFNKGDTQGYVRFTNEGGAKIALDAVKAANEDKLVIKEKECESKIIEGIEEKNYWILANEEKKRAAKNKSQNRFGNSRGRGGRRNFKKDRNQEGWRKRRREWEYPKENTENENAGEEKPKNQRIKFDEEGNAEKDTTGGEVVEKKAKVEETTAIEF